MLDTSKKEIDRSESKWYLIQQPLIFISATLFQYTNLGHFQDLGHEAILIIGNYTVIIGDPSGGNKARPQLSHEDVMKNTQTYLDQSGKILELKNKSFFLTERHA